MNMHLVVVRPFNGLVRGDAITEAALIADILQSEHTRDVVRVVTPERG
ncbi:MAG: hypothetical protein ABI369_13745 [Acetobacteraceae bacterium]